MGQFCSLYSSSSGNSLFFKDDSTKILIDAGVSLKKIKEGLEKIDEKIEDIDALLITHEHTDHIHTIASKLNIPIYVSNMTYDAINKKKSIEEFDNFIRFDLGKFFSVGTLDIYPFPTYHDAVEPCGFNIYSNSKKVTVATDLGHIDSSLFANLKNSDFLLLESNYEPEMLRYSKYPQYLKNRIASNAGHLSNEDASLVTANLVKGGLSNVMLGHLSRESNFPDLAIKTMEGELSKNGISLDNITLEVAKPDAPSNVITV